MLTELGQDTTSKDSVTQCISVNLYDEMLTSWFIEEGSGAAWLWVVVAEGVWFVGLASEEVHVGRGLAVVTGDVAKGGDGFLGVGANHGVEMILQGVENGDQHVHVVDANAHLGIGGVAWMVWGGCGKRGEMNGDGS